VHKHALLLGYISRLAKRHETFFVILLPILNWSYRHIMNEWICLLPVPNDLWPTCFSILFIHKAAEYLNCLRGCSGCVRRKVTIRCSATRWKRRPKCTCAGTSRRRWLTPCWGPATDVERDSTRPMAVVTWRARVGPTCATTVALRTSRTDVHSQSNYVKK
jgi:hypothetical protein